PSGRGPVCPKRAPLAGGLSRGSRSSRDGPPAEALRGAGAWLGPLRLGGFEPALLRGRLDWGFLGFIPIAGLILLSLQSGFGVQKSAKALANRYPGAKLDEQTGR